MDQKPQRQVSRIAAGSALGAAIGILISLALGSLWGFLLAVLIGTAIGAVWELLREGNDRPGEK